MSENQQPTQEEILQRINSRAAVDSEFRSRLLSEPHAAVQEAVGIQLPATFRIQFIEKAPDLDAQVVLPDFIEGAAELTEEELEAVAGGSEWFQICIGSSANVMVN